MGSIAVANRALTVRFDQGRGWVLLTSSAQMAIAGPALPTSVFEPDRNAIIGFDELFFLLVY